VSRLRGLDDSWLPRLAEQAHRLHLSARRFVVSISGPASASGHAVRAQPALAGSIGAVAVAALLVAVFGTHDPYDSDSGPTTSPTPSIQQPVQTLGPQPGASVPTYLTTAAFDLRHFAEVSRGQKGYALVSLRRYLTPTDLTRLFAGVDVARVFIRVPSPKLPTSVYPVNVLGSTYNNLVAGMQSQSRFAGLNAKTYAQIVAGFRPHTDREKLEKKLYQKLALAARYESAALAKPLSCGCVFAVVVHADYLRLAGLTGVPDVRAVDPAPPSVTLDQLSVLPLRPDFTTVVPRPGVLGVG